MTDKITVSDIVENLVVAAYKIVEHKIQIAMGEPPTEEAMNYNTQYQEWVMEHVRPMIKDAQQVKAIEAQSSREIIKMLAQGKITIEETGKLMALMRIQVDVEEKEHRLELQAKMMKLIGD